MNITITGPRSVGKTTISKIVASKLGLEYVSSDELGEELFADVGGLDLAIKSGNVKEIINSGGYRIILDIYDQRNNFLFDLAGGAFSSSSLVDASKKVREKACEKSVVIGLFPKDDLDYSIEFLFEREREREHFKDMDRNILKEKTVKKCNYIYPLMKDNCNFIVYVSGKNPEEVAFEIIDKLDRFR